jgi:hypothetical protein
MLVVRAWGLGSASGVRQDSLGLLMGKKEKSDDQMTLMAKIH